MKEQSKYQWNIHSEGFSNFVLNSLRESIIFSFLTGTSILSYVYNNRVCESEYLETLMNPISSTNLAVTYLVFGVIKCH